MHNSPAMNSTTPYQSMDTLANSSASPREEDTDNDRTHLTSKNNNDVPTADVYMGEEVVGVPQPGDEDYDEAIHGHHHAGHLRTVEDEEKSGMTIYRRAIFTTIPLFMGYAGMITLQHHIKKRMYIKDGDNSGSYIFGLAVGNLYLGNLVFRLMHNVLFTFLTPRRRVYLAYCCMCLAQSVLAVAYYAVCTTSIVWTFVAYTLSGVAIGTFESNLISSITPLGHATKSFAVIGIPIGFNLVSVGFFILFAIWPYNAWLEGFGYVFIGIANLCGLFFFMFFIPDVQFDASHDTAKTFWINLKAWRSWFPIVYKHCFALMGDMFCVSLFSSISYYIFDLSDIPLWPYSTTTMPKNAFFGIYNALSFSGDFFARRIAYRTKKAINPFFFLILSVIGAAMVLSKTALIAPIGMFLVMFANGSIYAHTTKFVDNEVDDRYNLIALSFWLFIGDAGSYVGSQVVAPIRAGLGPVEGAAAPPAAIGNLTNATTMVPLVLGLAARDYLS